MATAASLYTASTGLCADSIESVPGVDGVFALATYHVDKHEQQQATSSSSSPSSTQSQDELGQDEASLSATSSSPAYTRRGTCNLYYIASEGRDGTKCDKVDMIETPAILDMKWSLTKAAGKAELRRTLGVANAQGQITLHRLYGSEKASKLQSIGELQFNNRTALCLSLDFSDRRGGHIGGYNMSTPDVDTSLIVSQSDGSLAYLPSLELALANTCASSVDDVTSSLAETSIHKHTHSSAETEAPDDDWDRTSQDERDSALLSKHLDLNSIHPIKPRGLITWAAHEFESWICAFDCFSPTTTAWSGGDDLTLKGWDLRTPLSSPTTIPNPTFVCKKPFNGGVTSIQSHHLRQHLWAVGSYDGYLRLFDARMTARPLSETEVGGGVWRVKWHPEDSKRLLVGCMHDGFKVLTLEELAVEGVQGGELRGKEFCLATKFDQHKSLAYGCDWDRGLNQDPEESGRRVYSCSFYDATMHIWNSGAS
ncbi:uncharacterized protein MEPE_01854 [Melanopsichium pennsylvanicum]|uniref:methylated diphthine methylhydrolase n=2 Tax=Melanopsichium pennsylvanicum TaxID=63383 RepID=A0AAJ4XJ91_9BASI|nr:conserved hypothetical protein [Melanopsichium pennsylvanicum 4]SNX83148.1 uncharacterized protein MEPE_01854 [Melanopsichium pennsylvanicum]